jgi:hypothetical protein
MKKGGAALAGPIWNDVITSALKNLPVEYFDKPDPIDPSTPAIIRGLWQNDGTNVHSILYWIDKNNPLGQQPLNPQSDPQYINWEYGVQNWWNVNKSKYPIALNTQPAIVNPLQIATKPILTVTGFIDKIYKPTDTIKLYINPQSSSPIQKIDVFVNNTYLTSLKSFPYSVSFTPNDIGTISTNNTIRIIGYDATGNSGETSMNFQVEIN